MALSYDESAALMNDTAFRGRVKVACLNYANYILLEPNNTPAHVTRAKWANATMLNPDSAAAVVTPTVVMDPAVQQDGSAITDANLQGAVEITVDKMM